MQHSTIATAGKQEQRPGMPSLGILTRVLPGVCIAIGILLFFWPNAGEPKVKPKLAVNHLASSSARTRPIESLCVGDRVLAHNPEVSQSERDTFVEPDWTEWLHLSLAMPKADGSLLEIELLRPESWVREQMRLFVEPAESGVTDEQILSPLMQSADTDQHLDASPIAAPSERAAEDEATGVDSAPYSPLLPILRDIAFAGAELQLSGEELQAILVQMDLPELAITGEAIVLDIRGPLPIRPGAGRVVTATFHHSSGDVIDLVVGEMDTYSPSGRVASNASGEGSSSRDTIGTTSNHPFWSVDRQAYVQAGQLAIGERLQTYSGDTKRVISKLARPGPQPVYNLEVFAEHVYYVGQDGLLVHNSYVAPSTAARRPGGYHTGDTDTHRLLSPGVNRASGHTNTRADGFVQSHHGIQRQWAKRNINGYDEGAAPAVLLKSRSGEVHASISAAQRARRRQPGGWDTDIRTEFNLSYREMIDSGLSPNEAQRVIKQNYKYFDSIGAFK